MPADIPTCLIPALAISLPYLFEHPEVAMGCDYSSAVSKKMGDTADDAGPARRMHESAASVGDVALNNDSTSEVGQEKSVMSVDDVSLGKSTDVADISRHSNSENVATINKGFDIHTRGYPKPDFTRWFQEYTIPPLALAQISMDLEPDPDNVIPSPRFDAVMKRTEEIGAAQKRGRLTDPLTLEEFYGWAKERDYRIPPELAEQYGARKGSDARAEKSMAMLLVLMAQTFEIDLEELGKLANQPDSGKTERVTPAVTKACKNISAALNRIDLKLGPKPIRGHFIEAYKRLHATGWKPKKVPAP